MRKILFAVLALLAIAVTGFAFTLFKIDAWLAIAVVTTVAAWMTLVAFGKVGSHFDFRRLRSRPLLSALLFVTLFTGTVVFYTAYGAAMTGMVVFGLIITLAIIVKGFAASGRVALASLVPIDGIGYIDANGDKHYLLGFG